jgi:ParB-like chromosome segregation protein Spo0J
MGNLLGLAIIDKARDLVGDLALLSESDRIEALNQVRELLHEVSPFRNEPVDCVLWVRGEDVQANDYNPNVVAPPEMRLLELSIEADGFTQPIVSFPVNGHREVVDGFHRNLVAKQSRKVRERLRGYLPVTTVRTERQSREDRIASTIRHNRARGQHQVGDMSDIVVELSRRNWSEEKIGRELGMEPDEVLRLKQISGLAEMFADREFSEAWEVSFDSQEAAHDDGR